MLTAFEKENAGDMISIKTHIVWLVSQHSKSSPPPALLSSSLQNEGGQEELSTPVPTLRRRALCAWHCIPCFHAQACWAPTAKKKKMAFMLTSLPNTPQGLWAESESISVFLRPCLSPFSSLHLDLRINNPESKGKLLLHRWKEPRFLARACLTQTASMMYLIRAEGSFL